MSDWFETLSTHPANQSDPKECPLIQGYISELYECISKLHEMQYKQITFDHPDAESSYANSCVETGEIEFAIEKIKETLNFII
jgi:hypothetical protein